MIEESHAVKVPLGEDPALEGMSRTRIPLNALILESGNVERSLLETVVRTRYPGSVVQTAENAAEAREALTGGIFDLLMLCVKALDEGSLALFRELLERDLSMPTVVLLDQGDLSRFHEELPQACLTWEIAPTEPIDAALAEQHIRKAITNHQRHWELNHLQHAFQSSLIQYRNLFDEVPDLIFLVDRSGCLLDVNASAARMFETTKEALLLRPIFDAFGISHEDFDQLLERANAEHGPIEDVEIEFQPRGRRAIFGLAHLIRWHRGAGRPMQFQGVIKDISPHKRLEQKLRRSEDQYKTLYELARISASSLRLQEVVSRSLPLIHTCCHAESTLLLLNHNYDQLDLVESINLDPELQRRFAEETPPVIGQDLIGRLSITAGVQRFEEPELEEMHPVVADWFRQHEGCELICSTLGARNPTLPSSVLLMVVPSERAELLEDELLRGVSTTLEMGMTNCFHYANSQDAKTRYRELWENAPAFFISLLKGGIILEINRTASEALGFRMQDLVGQSFRRIVHPDDQDVFLEHHEALMEHGISQDYELRLKRRSGEVLIVSVRSEPLYDKHRARIGEKSVLNDITRDKAMDARLRDYADNLERMVEERTLELTSTMEFLNGILEGSTEYAIVGLDEQGRFLHFNRGAQLLFNYEAADMVGKRDLSALMTMKGTPWDAIGDLLEQVNRQGVLVQEVPMRTSINQQMTGLLTINRLKNPAENRLTYVAIVRDITEQKELEDLLKLYTENLQQVIEEKSQELDRQHMQLIQSSKLATLGEMATGIAHELNQPLSGIRTRAQLVTKALERNKLNKERVEQSQTEIIQLVDRITNIIHHMRIFARQDQQRFVPFQLTESIQGAMSLLGEQLRIHAIEVALDVPDECPSVVGEPLQIEQVILNLVSNARDAMDAMQELYREEGAEGYQKKLKLRVAAVSEQEICLEVRDNGAGMDEQTRARIYEPFFTTKPVGRGTGLGLSISYGILTNHNGRFEVESTKGEGTCFRIYLPICLDPESVEEAARREQTQI